MSITQFLTTDSVSATRMNQLATEVAADIAAVPAVPSGGTVGQVVTKNANGYGWADPTGGGSRLPTGGTTGQVLAKASNADGDVVWVDQTGGGSAYVNPIDKPPALPSQWDDEFDGATLDSKWSWVNQGSSTTEIVNGELRLYTPSVGDSYRALTQPKPTGNFEMTAKIVLDGALLDYFAIGVALLAPDNKVMVNSSAHRANFDGVHVFRLPGVSGWGGDYFLSQIRPGSIYYKIKLVGTTITSYCSSDGEYWHDLGNVDVSAFLVSIDRIGIAYFRNNTTDATNIGRIQWFRVNEII